MTNIWNIQFHKTESKDNIMLKTYMLFYHASITVNPVSSVLAWCQLLSAAKSTGWAKK